MNQEERDCLIKYSREPDNLPLALAIGAIQVDLRIDIRIRVPREVAEMRKGWFTTMEELAMERYRPPTSVAGKKDILMLSITREGSNWEIVLREWQERRIFMERQGWKIFMEWQGWKTYLGVKCDGKSALTREQLKHALVGVGTGGGYDQYNFKLWRYIEPLYDDLRSDEALKTMNVEEERQKFVEHYCEVLLKAVKALMTYSDREDPSDYKGNITVFRRCARPS